MSKSDFKVLQFDRAATDEELEATVDAKLAELRELMLDTSHGELVNMSTVLIFRDGYSFREVSSAYHLEVMTHTLQALILTCHKLDEELED